MNARQHELRLFYFQAEKKFNLGSIGIIEVNCENIDITYARVNSPELAMCIEENIRTFKSDVDEACCSGSAPRRTPSVGSPSDSAVPLLSAQIGVDFYQKLRRQSVGGSLGSWIGGTTNEDQTWEQWKLYLDIFRVESIDELAVMRQTVADKIGEMVLDMCERINQSLYTPKMPSKTEVGDIFETKFVDSQPYLFKIKRQAVPNIPTRPSFSQIALQRIWKDVLS
ncbi:unnamed protein product [Caenorhabditis bovis]|uniref:Autophagy-related protein 101 n=1 Tax=Caenorhabditis bovis TaxID=2654633 RepID=A0A8S1FAL0_9PELO|nr:unnamed protein product [Caenorhabditis bovis]